MHPARDQRRNHGDGQIVRDTSPTYSPRCLDPTWGLAKSPAPTGFARHASGALPVRRWQEGVTNSGSKNRSTFAPTVSYASLVGGGCCSGDTNEPKVESDKAAVPAFPPRAVWALGNRVESVDAPSARLSQCCHDIHARQFSDGIATHFCLIAIFLSLVARARAPHNETSAGPLLSIGATMPHYGGSTFDVRGIGAWALRAICAQTCRRWSGTRFVRLHVGGLAAIDFAMAETGRWHSWSHGFQFKLKTVFAIEAHPGAPRS